MQKYYALFSSYKAREVEIIKFKNKFVFQLNNLIQTGFQVTLIRILCIKTMGYCKSSFQGKFVPQYSYQLKSTGSNGPNMYQKFRKK